MKILMVCNQDTGGVLHQLRKAIRTYTNHDCMLVMAKRTYVDVGCHMLFDKNNPKLIAAVKNFAKKADVFHFNIGDERHYYPPFLNFAPFMKGKKVIRHFRGEWFRKNHRDYYGWCKKNGYHCIVSTPDLLGLIDKGNGVFLPNVFDVSLFGEKPVKKDDKILIVHSPTSPEIKGTKLFTQTVKRLSKEYSNVEYKLIMNKPRMECLRLKKEADIVFDQFGVSNSMYIKGAKSVRYAYGNNAIEGFALGVPVLVELNAKFRKAYKDFSGMACAAVQTSPKTLFKDLEKLIVDAKYRKKIGKKSRQYYMKAHSPRTIARRYIDIIEGI